MRARIFSSVSSLATMDLLFSRQVFTMNRHPDQWGSIEIPLRVAERATTRYVQIGDCRISTYSTASHGYSQIGWCEAGKTYMTLAHRAAWVHFHGQIPIGETVDHVHDVCLDRRCVHEPHLRLLSNFENARRTDGRNWRLGICINTHSNAHLVFTGGRWRCRLCKNQQQREYAARKRLLGIASVC